MNASVIVYEIDAPSPPVRPRPAASRPRRSSTTRMAIGAAIVSIHGAFAWLVISLPGEIHPPQPAEELVVVAVRPLVIVSREPISTSRQVLVPKDAPIAYDIQVPDGVRPVVVVAGVGTMPPHADDAVPDAAPYARDAGLKPGEGATVVLRLEILGSGELDRVDIDVSGGRAEIDQAAIAYARAIQWNGGMIDGRPVTIWIRWGIRLQA